MIPGVPRLCLDCGARTFTGSRCQAHQSQLMARMDAARGPRPQYAKGYTAAARKVRANATACHWCGEGFTLDNPVQADHVLPGDPDSPLVPACRRCNNARRRRPSRS
jgi:hypothetical protein